MPGKITALEPQKRRAHRVNVYLDGTFAFGLDELPAAQLHVGQQLTDADIDRLLAEDSVERARGKALDFLSYRPRSAVEVRTRLKEREFTEDVIETVVDRLESVGLINDIEFALYWMQNRAQFRPKGRRALAYELRQKGVADSIIEQTLDEYDERRAAFKVAQDQARRLGNLPQDVMRRKLYSRMARRGFSYEVINEAMETLAAHSQNDNDVDEIEEA